MKLCPNIEIINYFDKLVDRVDIDIEQSIEKLGDRLFKDLNCLENRKVKTDRYYLISNESSQTNNEQCEDVLRTTNNANNEVTKWTKVDDYLNQIRTRTIEELRKAEEESLKYLKSHASLNDLKDADELKSRLFANKFYFQVHYNPNNKAYQDAWVFNLYTFVVDFYLAPSEINFLEYYTSLF